MDEIRKNIRRVFWLYFVLFAVLSIYLAKFVLFDSKSITASPYNPRLKLQNPAVTRGAILDAHGEILAYTDENGARAYPFGSAAAHAVGYANAGGAGSYGVEAKYNFQLQTADWEIVQRLRNISTGGAIMGNSAVLTIDAELQEFIYAQLKGNSAGAVVLEPSTGKIKAMVSVPSFDPNTLAGDFEGMPEGRLLNRAAQGLYPPGSVFKIVTAAAALESGQEGFAYTCAGEDAPGGKRIRCYNSAVHGEEDLARAFAFSCNTYFSNLGLRIGPDALRAASERLFFNAAPPYPLECSASDFPLSKSSEAGEIVDTSIGQGKTMASPLQIALIASAIANNGILMSPYILDHIENKNGAIVRKYLPKMSKNLFNSETASTLSGMMVGVTEHGTGAAAAVPGVKIAAKTGSAETPTGNDHGWYTAFFPADDPQYAICLIVENIGGSSRVLPIAKNIIEHLTN